MIFTALWVLMVFCFILGFLGFLEFHGSIGSSGFHGFLGFSGCSLFIQTIVQWLPDLWSLAFESDRPLGIKNPSPILLVTMQ